MAETDLGAPTTIKTPDILKKAEAQATQLMDLGGLSPEERNRVITYRSEPYMQQLGKLTDYTNKMFESQGLRFGTERRGRLGEITTEIGKQIGESVIVPQIERAQEESRANIQLGAQVGGELFSQELQTKQLQQQAAQFAQTIGLDKDRFLESVRQFNAGYDLQDRELTEKVRQFNASLEQAGKELTQQQTQFEQTYKLSERQTTMAELDSAAQRTREWARVTGQYVDPVTGDTLPTIEQKQLESNEKLTKSALLGYWEEESSVTPDDLFESEEWAALFKEVFGEDWPGLAAWRARNGGGDGGDGGDGSNTATAAAAAAAKATKDAEELQRLSGWSNQSGIPTRILGMATAALPDDVEQDIINRMVGGTLTVGELLDALDGQPEALLALGDYIIGDLQDPNSAVRLVHSGDTGIMGRSIFPIEQALGRSLSPRTRLTAADVQRLRSSGMGAVLDEALENGYLTVEGGEDLGGGAVPDIDQDEYLAVANVVKADGVITAADEATLRADGLGATLDQMVAQGMVKLSGQSSGETVPDIDQDEYLSVADKVGAGGVITGADEATLRADGLGATLDQMVAQGMVKLSGQSPQTAADLENQPQLGADQAGAANTAKAQAQLRFRDGAYAYNTLSENYPALYRDLQAIGRLDLEPTLYKMRSGQPFSEQEVQALRDAGINITGMAMGL